MKRRTRLQIASIPAAALVAALCFAPTAATARPADGPRNVTTFHLPFSTYQRPVSPKAGGSPPNEVAVRAGDTLSQIAAAHRTTWAALAGFNHVAAPNLIMPGQKLLLPPAGYKPPASTPPVFHARTATPGTGYKRSTPVTYGGGTGGAFGGCVRARENGGSYAWGTGDGGGAYQFEPGTWVAYGGSPGSYGNASPAEQDAVFLTAVARGGQGNWRPYDGC